MLDRKSILIKSEEIKNRVSSLGKSISERLQSDSISELVVLWLADGALFFATDLIRNIDCADMEIRSLKVSSYGEKLESNGEPEIIGDVSKLSGKTVLLIDDIFDTGRTADVAIDCLQSLGVDKILTCFLFDKKVQKHSRLVPDFVGFTIDDVYIFGYGLDAAEKFRNLPDVWKFDV